MKRGISEGLHLIALKKMPGIAPGIFSDNRWLGEPGSAGQRLGISWDSSQW